MTANTCTNASNTCEVNNFCPATDATETACKPCDATIITDQGCNCVANTPIANCMTCDTDKCKTCISGFIASADGTSCTACSADCTTCSDAATCTACKTGFVVVDKTCAACSANCTTCTDPSTCTACETDFTLVSGACKASASGCSAEKPCTVATEFCDLTSMTCKVCGTDCSKCKSELICGGCSDAMKQLTTIGICEAKCSAALNDGQYCKAGVPTKCRVDIMSSCKCGTATNCATCDPTMTKCGDCLLGFKKDGDNCVQCDDGFETYETLCLAPKLPAGKCSKASNSCAVDSYCPATNNTMTDCIPCDDNIKIWQGCNCVLPATNTTPNRNCRTCAKGACTKCIKSHFLNESGTKCDVCDMKCADCNSLTDCKQCKPKFYLDNKSCKSCTAGCTICKSLEVCGGCDAGKQLTISGACEADCTAKPPADGEFCKAGTATACAAGLTSQCKCGTSTNCAACDTTKTKCGSCLPGFKMAGSECVQCADGFEKYEKLCLVAKKDVSKLSGGAIAGIVIACIVVAGGVGGGLAYYFVKKGKSGASHKDQKAALQ